MPYSRENNVLFIHIPKNAGKSFEVAMKMVEEHEVKKYKWRSTFNRACKYLLNLSRDRKSLPRLWGIHDISLALQHLTYTEIELLNLLDKEILENSLKVAIVRNPFDRAVSSYHHMGKEKYKSFLDFVQKYYSSISRDHNDLAHKRSQIDFLRDKEGTIIVENVLKFENLANDFENFKVVNDLKCNSIPHLGKQRNKEKYQEYYCAQSKKIISNIFRDDLEKFCYKF